MIQKVKLPIVGSRVSVLKRIDLHPHAVVAVGSHGIITRSDWEFVDIMLREVVFADLDDNIAWLCPRYDNVWEYLCVTSQMEERLCA